MAKYLTMEQFEGFEDLSVEVDSFEPGVDADKKIVETGSREHIINLQLVMATTSVNHEYARIEFDETKDIEKKEELMHYMAECTDKYNSARDELSCVNPLVLETFESELAQQKRATMVHYHA